MSSFLPQSLKCHYFFRKWFKSYWTLFWHSLWRASIFFVLETMIYKLMNSLLRQSLKSFFLNADNDIKVSEELLFLIFWDNDIKVIKFSFATVSEEHSFLFYLTIWKTLLLGGCRHRCWCLRWSPLRAWRRTSSSEPGQHR